MVAITITSKGQIVIPSKIRKHLGLKKGTRLSITEQDDKIIIQPITADFFKKMAGFLGTKGTLTKALLEERAKDREKEDR